MNTLLQCQGGTFVVGDSLFQKLLKALENCQQAGTHWECVVITLIICVTIYALARIAKNAYLKVHESDKNGGKGNQDGKGDSSKDPLPKQVSTLLDKLVDFQKELAFPYEKGKDGEYKRKQFDAEESKTYKQLLWLVIRQLETEKLKDGSKEIAELLGLTNEQPQQQTKPTETNNGEGK